MSEPRELTDDEVRDLLLMHAWRLVDYWEKETRAETLRERLVGVIFSFLGTLDGVSPGLPGFTVAPCPAPSDLEFCRSVGANWFPNGIKHDVAGSLHDRFFAIARTQRLRTK